MADGGKHWGIVGGGMLGMALARKLTAAGHRVTVLEAADEAGGLAATWEIGGVRWDKHYHVILEADTLLLDLLGQIGLGEEVVWRETRTGLFARGKTHSVSTTAEFLRLPVLSLWAKLRLGLTVLYASRIRDWRRLEAMPVERWLRRWSGDRAFEDFWRPLLRSKLGDNYRLASASFIWAIMQRLYGARRSGRKVETLGYVNGGYAAILDALTRDLAKAGVELMLGTRVSAVRREAGAVSVATQRGRLTFDEVVVTVAAPLAARVIEGLSAAEVTRLHEVVYQGIVCTSVMLDRELAGYYVTNITDEGLPFTGIIEMTSLVDRGHFGGRHLVYLPRYTTRDDALMALPVDDVERHFLDGLATMYPDFDEEHIVAMKTSRVRYVLPVSTIDFSQRTPPTRTSVPGVYIVSSAQIVNGTLNVNETLGVVEAALPELLGSAGDRASPVEVPR